MPLSRAGSLDPEPASESGSLCRGDWATGGAAAPPEGGYDAFGPARMFWDTDITRMPCPVAPVRDAVQRRAAVAPRA